jgi:Uma2 family endonuclease
MTKRVSVDDYLALAEQLRPHELVWGVVREPPAPKYGHQSVVGRVFYELETHVRARDLGVVCVAPLDVILDLQRGLVLQPDVLFVSRERTHIIRHQVWGAPDLVVEVVSRRTVIRDRTTKVSWYRRYGVRECWILDPSRRTFVVADLTRRGRSGFRFFKGDDPVKSVVLPDLVLPASSYFD